MEVEYTGRQTEVPARVRKLAERKLKKLEKFVSRPLRAHVILTVDRHRQIAEVSVHSPRLEMTATEETDDMNEFDPDEIDPARREVLWLLGSVAAAGMLGCSSGGARAATESPTEATSSGSGTACVVRPQQTEGPYFVDEKLNRSDIRTDPSNGKVSDGALLDLTIRLSKVSGAS